MAPKNSSHKAVTPGYFHSANDHIPCDSQSHLSFSLNISENTSFLCIATSGGETASAASESFKIAYNTETEQELNIHFYIRDDILFLSMCFRLLCVRMLRCFSRVSRSYFFPESIISSRMSLEHTLSGGRSIAVFSPWHSDRHIEKKIH